MFDRWQLSALDHGIRIGETVALPVHTRSVTKAEALGRDRGIAVLFLAIGLLILLALLASAIGNLAVGSGAPAGWPAFALAIIVCAVGAMVMWNRRAEYADPQIAVEVGEDGIIVRSPAGEEAIAFAEVDYDVRKYNMDGGADFIGIVLACRAGTVDMHDLLYRGGKSAAAAILAKAVAAGRRPNGIY